MEKELVEEPSEDDAGLSPLKEKKEETRKGVFFFYSSKKVPARLMDSP